jgi:hypothetical protein
MSGLPASLLPGAPPSQGTGQKRARQRPNIYCEAEGFLVSHSNFHKKCKHGLCSGAEPVSTNAGAATEEAAADPDFGGIAAGSDNDEPDLQQQNVEERVQGTLQPRASSGGLLEDPAGQRSPAHPAAEHGEGRQSSAGGLGQEGQEERYEEIQRGVRMVRWGQNRVR